MACCAEALSRTAPDCPLIATARSPQTLSEVLILTLRRRHVADTEVGCESIVHLERPLLLRRIEIADAHAPRHRHVGPAWIERVAGAPMQAKTVCKAHTFRIAPVRFGAVHPSSKVATGRDSAGG